MSAFRSAASAAGVRSSIRGVTRITVQPATRRVRSRSRSRSCARQSSWWVGVSISTARRASGQAASSSKRSVAEGQRVVEERLGDVPGVDEVEQRDLGRAAEPDRTCLELGEDEAETRRPRPPRIAVEQRLQRGGGVEAEPVGDVGRVLELGRAEAGREVEQGAGDGRGRDSLVVGHLVGGQRVGVEADAVRSRDAPSGR